MGEEILVVGAGIGGLVLALSLDQVGLPVKVFESAPEIKPLGVGINLLPHAVRELTELGLFDQLKEVAVQTAALDFYNKHGQLIQSEPRGIEAGYHWPQLSIHRGALQQVLLDETIARIGSENVITGHHFEDCHSHGEEVTAVFRSEGSTIEHSGSLLIGADGIHSAVRAKFYPNEGPPIWNGAVLWRGTTIAQPFLTGRTMIMAGHEFQKLVCYPITNPDENGESVINWVAELKFEVKDPWRSEDWNRTGVPEDFMPAFENWQFPFLDVPELIRGAGAVFEYPMVDRDPLPVWTFDRVTLIGDAAHPMYPIGSNGASQAILDARVLTASLQHSFTPAALMEYEDVRRPATSQIVLANRGNGPDRVLQIVEERAPEGFESLEDVISAAELDEIAHKYRQIAGFDIDQLNAREPLVDSR